MEYENSTSAGSFLITVTPELSGSMRSRNAGENSRYDDPHVYYNGLGFFPDHGLYAHACQHELPVALPQPVLDPACCDGDDDVSDPYFLIMNQTYTQFSQVTYIIKGKIYK